MSFSADFSVKFTMLKGVIYLLLCLALMGCASMPRPSFVLKPSKSEVSLVEELKKKNQTIEELNKKVADAEAVFKKNYDFNLSFGVASAWSAYDTLLAEPNKTKYTSAAILGLEVTIKALPEPKLIDYRATTETQRKLLSDLAKEVEEGKKEIEAQKKIIEEKKLAAQKALDEKTALEQQKKAVEKQFEVKKEELQVKIDAEKNQELANSQQKIQDAQDKKDLQLLIVKVLMAVAVVAGLLALVLKRWEPALGSALAIALAIGVSFLPMWAIFTGVAGVLALVVFAAVHAFMKEKKVADNSVGAIQQFKDRDPVAFANGLKQDLEDWNKSHPAVTAQVEKKLKELNLKN